MSNINVILGTFPREHRVKPFLHEIEKELKESNEKYPQFHSNHEGYAVIKEELDELWDEIKADKGLVPTERMIEEVIQVAAMCLKFCVR